MICLQCFFGTRFERKLLNHFRAFIRLCTIRLPAGCAQGTASRKVECSFRHGSLLRDSIAPMNGIACLLVFQAYLSFPQLDGKDFQEAAGKATIFCSTCFGGMIDQNFSASPLETALFLLYTEWNSWRSQSATIVQRRLFSPKLRKHEHVMTH